MDKNTPLVVTLGLLVLIVFALVLIVVLAQRVGQLERNAVHVEELADG